MNRTPDSYIPASLRCVLPFDILADGLGIAFDLCNGETIRLFLDHKSSERLIAIVSSYLGDHSQSATSTGIPSLDVSMPDEGVNV